MHSLLLILLSIPAQAQIIYGPGSSTTTLAGYFWPRSGTNPTGATGSYVVRNGTFTVKANMASETYAAWFGSNTVGAVPSLAATQFGATFGPGALYRYGTVNPDPFGIPDGNVILGVNSANDPSLAGFAPYYNSIAGGYGNTTSNFFGYYGFIGGGFDNHTDCFYNVITGGASNIAECSNIGYASIGGGQSNQVTSDWAAVGGGLSNNAAGLYSAIPGGYNNIASGDYSVAVGSGNRALGMNAVVGGGEMNSASDIYTTIGGGKINSASDDYATISGGLSNTASMAYSSIPGGFHNTASGSYSIAAGSGAVASGNGSFVWSDRRVGGTLSSVADSFKIGAQGGFFVDSTSATFQNAGITLFTVDATSVAVPGNKFSVGGSTFNVNAGQVSVYTTAQSTWSLFAVSNSSYSVDSDGGITVGCKTNTQLQGMSAGSRHNPTGATASVLCYMECHSGGSFDLYCSTGSGRDQWRSQRTGTGP